MIDAEETKRFKSKQLRYKRPIVKNLNLYSITQDLWDIQEECENVRWYTESEDGNDSLINALAGDEDEAYEFKMAFADLCAECDRMREDIEEEWVPECFDIFFVAAGAGESWGGLLGWDSYEQDYFGISCDSSFAEDEAKKKLKQMTKEDLIEASAGLTNLGAVYVPDDMKPYLERFDIYMGIPYSQRTNCAIASFGDTLTVNFASCIIEADVERRFFQKLVEDGIAVTIESNRD